jgi:hypothetical protein
MSLYTIDVEEAKRAAVVKTELGYTAEEHLDDLMHRLQIVVDDMCMPAEEIIRVVCITAVVCTQLATQAMKYVQDENKDEELDGE